MVAPRVAAMAARRRASVRLALAALGTLRAAATAFVAPSFVAAKIAAAADGNGYKCGRAKWRRQRVSGRTARRW